MSVRREITLIAALAAVAAILFVPPGQPLALAAVVTVVLLCTFAGIAAARAGGLVLLPRVPAAAPFAAVGAGVVLGVAALLPVVMLSEHPAVQARWREEVAMPVWRRLLIAFDSAVIEEIGFRLFILSVVAWLLMKVMRRTRAVAWANAAAALAFAAAHVPRWLSLNAGTTLLLVVIVVNFAGALLLGAIYLRRGLGLVMLAHFFADVVVHVIAPAVMM